MPRSAMGDRSRSPHRQGKFWRVLVSDGQDRQPVRIYEHQMGSEKDVEDFLAAVKKAEGLDGAALSQMRLFRNADNADSQQAEAFETSMSEIPSHGENVLIVTYRMKNVAAPEALVHSFSSCFCFSFRFPFPAYPHYLAYLVPLSSSR